MEIVQKLEVFQNLLGCVGEISLWHFDSEMHVISTNSPDPDLFSAAFSIDGSRDILLEHFHKNTMPVIISNGLSFTWLAAPYFVQKTLVDVYMIGPVFTSLISEEYLRRRILEYHMQKEWELLSIQDMGSVPVVSFQALIQYGVMLYYCIYDRKILPEAIKLLPQPRQNEEQTEIKRQSRDLEYALQLEIMQAVEDGDIGYVHPRGLYFAVDGTISREGPLRQAKNIMITFITEITRAAVRGGMSPTDAFSLSDYYIQISEGCTDTTEVYQNGQTCLRDFTLRVHQIRQKGYSRVVRDCLSYIARNVQNKVTMDDIAKALNYNKNYLSTKVHEETGMTIRQTITQEKLKQAALWLSGSSKPIQDICHELGFGSPSYFSSQFRKAYGVTPTEYRSSEKTE